MIPALDGGMGRSAQRVPMPLDSLRFLGPRIRWIAQKGGPSGRLGHGRVLRTLRSGGGAKATLRLVEYAGGVAVLKDYSACARLFRWVCGRFLARREARAYRHADGVPGVVRCFGRVGGDGLLLEFAAGGNCRAECGASTEDTPSRRLTLEFFDELRQNLGRLRAAGVLHLDLKRNVLMSAAGSPLLADFTAAVVVSGPLRLFRHPLQRLAAAYEEREIIKLKRLAAPELITAEEHIAFARPLPLASLIHAAERLLRLCKL